MSEDAVVVELPTIIKALPSGDRRIVEVEASCEVVDSEGDLILQRALLNSANQFVAKGALDLDHLSEVGARYGIQNTQDWVVGKPIEVKDLGGGRTAVVGELFPHVEGKISKADELWDALQGPAPQEWRSSIYGFPRQGDIIDCRNQRSAEFPDATRYVVKGIDWKSLAFTKSPVCDGITGSARIVTAKAFVHGLMRLGSFGAVMKAQTAELQAPTEYLLPPRNRVERMGHFQFHMENGRCPYAGPNTELGRSILTFREHFMMCCCEDYDQADLQALALMQQLKRHSY